MRCAPSMPDWLAWRRRRGAARGQQPRVRRGPVHGGARPRRQRPSAGPPEAFHTAIRAGEDEIVEYVADHGADFDVLDQFGRTPLEEAEFEAPTHTIKLMRRLAAERPAGIR